MEQFKVKFTKTAKADINSAIHYIAVDLCEPDTAERISIRVKAEIASLKTMPERFPLVEDSYLASLGFRKTAVGNYLIFYTVSHEEHQVCIHRILYGKRNWITLLSEDD